MENGKPSLPDYDNPPVSEVVFGIQFNPLKELKSHHIGLFWEKLGREDYPELKEVAPIAHITENFEQTVEQVTNVTILTDKLPLPRVFFIDKTKNNLIQVQEDRFLQNWRKIKDLDEYPRFSELSPKFHKSCEEFNSFLQDFDLGTIETDQYELTYVNHIPLGQGWGSLSDIENIFSEIQCGKGKGFLPEVENMNWRKTYKFPDSSGRLHASFRIVFNKQANEQMMVLDLTARGFSENIESWFENAHEWIVRGFADLTSEAIQKSCWGKK